MQSKAIKYKMTQSPRLGEFPSTIWNCSFFQALGLDGSNIKRVQVVEETFPKPNQSEHIRLSERMLQKAKRKNLHGEKVTLSSRFSWFPIYNIVLVVVGLNYQVLESLHVRNCYRHEDSCPHHSERYRRYFRDFPSTIFGWQNLLYKGIISIHKGIPRIAKTPKLKH